MPAQITHREWRDAMTDARGLIDTALMPGLSHMRGLLGQMQAGQRQLADAARMVEVVGVLGQQASVIIAAHDAPQRAIGEAQAAAGGRQQVAGRRDYNQR